MTMKTIAHIYIDADVKERHKIAGTNISAVCNEFLKTFFQDDEVTEVRDTEAELQKLRAQMAKLNAQSIAQKQMNKIEDEVKLKERLTVAIVKLRELNYKKQNGSLISAESYKALFDATMIEFELTRQELAEKVF